MKLVPVQSDEQWEALLTEQPDRSLYHTTAWLKYQAEQFKFDLHRLVIEHQGRPVGLFPLFITRRAIFRVAASPRGIDYLNLGPLLAPELLGELLDCYERWVRKHRVDYSSIAFMREIDTETAASRGYKCERHKLCIVDLREGEDAVLAAFTRSCRKEIRKAERKGVRIIEGDMADHIDRYLELSQQTWARSGKDTPLTEPILTGMLTALRDSNSLLDLRAEMDGRTIGMYVVGHDKRTGYSLDIVSDRDFAKHAPNNLMTWHALRWCCRAGLEEFDFGGARISSIARFKMSFGGQITPYTNITKAHSLMARGTSALAKATIGALRQRQFRRSQKGKVTAETVARKKN